MSPAKKQKLENGSVAASNGSSVDDGSVDEMLDELAGSRAKVADDVSEYAFNKNRVRLLAGNEGKIAHYVTIGLLLLFGSAVFTEWIGL
jgi:hypothetical protein